MYHRGHVGVALLVWAPIGAWLVTAGAPGLALVGGATMIALAGVPDYDYYVPLMSHRGASHSLAFALVVGAVFGAGGWWLGASGPGTVVFAPGALSGADPALVLGAFWFGVGTLAIAAHQVADVITPAGSPLLWPLSGHHYSLGLCGSGHPVANYGSLALGAFATALAVLWVL